MRNHYEAAGRVTSAAIANGDKIVNSYDVSSNDRGHFGVHIEARNTTLQINADPAAQYLTGTISARLAHRDGFSPEVLPEAAAAREVLVNDRELRDFDGDILVLECQADDSDMAIFDGIRVARPVYAYKESFSLQEYREVINDLVFRNREAMEIIAKELDIDLTGQQPIEPASPEQDGGRSFY